ncbi:DUF3515 domain-containing protein [Microbacterium schleiferi]|uniref:DUF3515 domain-containing protein n=1 Tax=Microbacterium schleiferi TaxID=69362 RepID=A0A7S8MVS0_9MICO|nr:DUF3515 domain-containing protein [Microbacterium schleiferi]QPE03543.1 DUF3515 domain-containing protein [Microbacterium schleiferi]
MPFARRAAAATVTCATSLLILAACSTTVSLQPAPDANNPHCADVTVRFPQTLDGFDRRWTDAQSTGAWGDDGASDIIVACGVDVPGPTTLPCSTLSGVDWIVDDADAPYYRITSFGTDPAVEVYLDSDTVSSAEVLDTLGNIIVDTLPVNGLECTDLTSGASSTDG